MPILTRCPNPACGVSASVADSLSGHRVLCKQCGTPFVARLTVEEEKSNTKPETKAAIDPFPSLPADFDRYRVLRLLGRGGMGSVYLAEDTYLGRPVALKLPSFGPDESRDRVERFVREGRSAAALHHPNICPIYDAGQIGDQPFIAMAFVEGTPLNTLIDSEQPMPQRRAATLARQVARALAHAHSKSIVHRDLKPANVMVRPDGQPVVMDFGLAKRVADTDSDEAKLTRDGAILGTPSYMAPEQVKGEVDRIGPATDVYALGVVLFEMLTGRPPYLGSLGVVMGQILAAPVPLVSEFQSDVAPWLADVCQRAMAKDPSDRFPTMAAFAEALKAYLVAESAVEVAPPVVPVPPAAFADLDEEEPSSNAHPLKWKSRKPARWKPWILIGTGLAGLLVVLLGVWFTVRTKYGDVVIELSDPAAKVEVAVDGGRIDISSLDRPLKLTVGDHGLTVTGPDFETGTQSFTVKSGVNPVMRVTLEPKPTIATSERDSVPKANSNSTPGVGPRSTTASSAMASSEWVPLFNGKDLTGWTDVNSRWQVSDGVLHCLPKKGDGCPLISDKTYRNFELRCSARVLGHGVGVVRIRRQPKVLENICEIWMGQTDKQDLWGSLGRFVHGGNAPVFGYGNPAPTAAMKPVDPNDFNRLLLRVVDRRVWVSINDGDLREDHLTFVHDSGSIQLGQRHLFEPREIAFKDVELRELDEHGLPLKQLP